ncbi:hypothetical protein ACWD04_18325 [Streptomyces sp. NPDC002911]
MTGLDLTTDVLVAGSGPAATSATSAALEPNQDGADVVLDDRGHCGTSGASAGTGASYVPRSPPACFQRESNCPADALHVEPLTRPPPADPTARDEEHLDRGGLLGSYRRHIGWGQGRTPGARRPSPSPGTAGVQEKLPAHHLLTALQITYPLITS